MNSKLTLSLNKEVIERAKHFAKSNNRTLPNLVETQLRAVTKQIDDGEIHPEIKKLMGYWDKREPIPWVRVNSLPDHVYFPHMMHIRAKLDCTACHGQVATMERISRTASLKMGWCLGCHRQHKASIDCWTCHI